MILQQWADGAEFNDSFEVASSLNKDLYFAPPGVSTLDAYNAHYGTWLEVHFSDMTGLASGHFISAEDTLKDDVIRTQQAQIERMIKTLETFNGRNFVPLIQPELSTVSLIASALPGGSFWNNWSGSLPEMPLLYIVEQGRYDLLKQSYDHLVDSIYSALATQTRLKPYLTAIELKIDNAGISLDFTAMNAMLDNKKSVDIVKGYTDLLELYKYSGHQLINDGWDGLTTLRTWVEQGITNTSLQAIFTEFGVKLTSGSITGTAKGDFLFGLATNDTLNGGLGNDALDAGAGNDTLYGGDGNDVVNGGADNDNVQFAADILPTDIGLSRSGYDLWLAINGTTDKLTVSGYFQSDAASANIVEQLKFANGTVWDVAAVKGKAGNDNLQGYATADTFTGGAGNDTCRATRATTPSTAAWATTTWWAV